MQDIITENDVYKVVGGDFAIEESTAQHQRALIIDRPGDYKENPSTGVDAMSYIDDEGLQLVAGAISRAFAQDGMVVNKVSIGTDGTINADAKYKQ